IKTLNVLGGIILVLSFISTIVITIEANLLVALPTLIGGIFSAILFFAFAYTIDLLEQNNFYLKHLYNKSRDSDPKSSTSNSMGRSRASLDKMQGYKFDGVD